MPADLKRLTQVLGPNTSLEEAVRRRRDEILRALAACGQFDLAAPSGTVYRIRRPPCELGRPRGGSKT
jgi:hypothetical protein